jgi:uncharacterized lipoprotein YddW (UPF0748 family)
LIASIRVNFKKRLAQKNAPLRVDALWVSDLILPPAIAYPEPTIVEPVVAVAPVQKKSEESGPPPTLVEVSHQREMRGIWITMASNVEWPSTMDLTGAQQKEELIALLD